MTTHKAVAVSPQRRVGPEFAKHLAGKAMAETGKRAANPPRVRPVGTGSGFPGAHLQPIR
ncbi:hypothetical protein FK498_13875 [Elioraea sp. Yellowstone]|jgi:hypothetical protein|uniref:hypothetical protein n=1 Tax=Elioraea sp. Yellowstone TaxID=2592070 RepID=UPI00114F993B|nr:hypothetical protein [Elioraea sp. Yellowstone]TQF77195.1 hypothetical protein FK498_13875 [Elioraea sp. Yellowstone]